MYTKSINAEIMIGSDANEVIEDLFKSLLQGYQEDLEEKMKGSEFVFDGVNSLYYDLNKIKNQKDDKCFQYALTVAINYEKIKDNRHRISKVKPFIDHYN